MLSLYFHLQLPNAFIQVIVTNLSRLDFVRTLNSVHFFYKDVLTYNNINISVYYKNSKPQNSVSVVIKSRFPVPG